MGNYNYNNGANYKKNNNNLNSNYPNGNYPNYPPVPPVDPRPPYYSEVPKKKGNTALIVLAIVMACIAVVSSAVAITLHFNKPSNDKPTPQTSTSTETLIEEDIPVTQPENKTASSQTAKEPEDIVVKTMYVDCNTTLNLRNGPGKSYDIIYEIPTGDAVDYIRDAGGGFSKVIYNGSKGYVSTEYLSNTKPTVWYYNETEVEQFVEDVLYAYVTSINTDNVNYLTQYLSGQAVNDARKNHPVVTKVTSNEEVISVNCHSVKRVAKNKVTVVRESVIRVYRHSGEVKDVTEKYLTTVENTSNGMKVVKFTQMK